MKSKSEIIDEVFRDAHIDLTKDNTTVLTIELCDMCMTRYAQSREQPWVRVDSGQLPEVGEWIIMHHDYGDREDLSLNRYNKNLARFLKDNQVTHWMRINPPAPPKD